MKKSIALLQIATLAAVTCFASATVASAEEKVVVYTVIPFPELNRKMNEEFTRRTGIKVELLNVPAVGTLAARIRSEKDKPRADVFASAPVDFHEGLAKDGLLLPYKSPELPPDAVAKGYADPNGNWTGWFASTTAIFWNSDRYKKDVGENVPTPKTWEDLLKPEFKGKLVSANPQTSAIGFVQLATQIFRLGEEKGWNYLINFAKNTAQFTPSAPLTVTLVEKGEAPVGVYWLGDILTSKFNRNQPIEYVVPQDNAVVVWAGSIVKGGPNPEAAKKYIDFLTSEYVQDNVAKLGFFHPLNPKVAPPKGAPSLSDMTVVKYDMDWATQNMDRLRKKWGQVSGH